MPQNQKRVSYLLKKQNEENRTGRQNHMLACPTTKYARNIKQLTCICLLGLGFFSISVPVLKTFPEGAC